MVSGAIDDTSLEVELLRRLGGSSSIGQEADSFGDYGCSPNCGLGNGRDGGPIEEKSGKLHGRQVSGFVEEIR